MRKSKDTTGKSHIVITQNNIIIHIANLASPLQAGSRLKSSNYQATLTIPINDQTKQLSCLKNKAPLIFEFDTTYLTEVLYERDPTVATIHGQNHTLRLEEKSIELSVSRSPLFDTLDVGKQNNHTCAIEHATGLRDKNEIDAYRERLHTFNKKFEIDSSTELNIENIRELEALSISGNSLVMGVLYPDGSVYLQNDMCSFKIEMQIETNLFNDKGVVLKTPFPFTAEVLKSLSLLKLLNVSHVNYCVVADKLLIEASNLRFEFTLPRAVIDFTQTCQKDLGSYNELFSESFIITDTKERIIYEIKDCQKTQAFFSINIADDEVSTSLITPSKGARIFTLFKTKGKFNGYKIHTKDMITLVQTASKCPEVTIFTQKFNGLPSAYLEIQNGKQCYGNTLIKLEKH